MKRKLASAALILALGAGFTANAVAQAKPELLVKQRKAAMTLQLKYLGPLFGMAQGKVPFNAEVVARNAGYLDILDQMAWDGFAESTKDIESLALPAIWSDPAKFKQAQVNFQSAVNSLVAAAKGGDQEKIKAAIKGVGDSCNTCHDDFRKRP